MPSSRRCGWCFSSIGCSCPSAKNVWPLGRVTRQLFLMISIEEQNYNGAYHEGFFEFCQFFKLMLGGGKALCYKASFCIFREKWEFWRWYKFYYFLKITFLESLYVTWSALQVWWLYLINCDSDAMSRSWLRPPPRSQRHLPEEMKGLQGRQFFGHWGNLRQNKWLKLLNMCARYIKEVSRQQTCAKIPKRSQILDPQDPGSGILQDLGSCIFTFSWDPKDLDPVTAILPWDPRDLGSQTGKILLDPGGPGSSLSRLSWDLEDLGSCTTIRPLYFDHPLQPMTFCFRFPLSMRCLNFYVTWHC